MPRMAVPAETTIRPWLDLQYSSVEIPSNLENAGLYIEFPTNPDTGKIALTGIKLPLGQKASLVYPSFTVRDSPVHIILESMPARGAFPELGKRAYPEQGKITYVYSGVKGGHFLISRSSENPWKIGILRETVANAYWDSKDRSLHINPTLATLPVAILVHPRRTCTFFVDYQGQSRPLDVEDVSQGKSEVGRPNPRAFVEFHTGKLARLNPFRPTTSWMVGGKTLCTFSFLTPPLGLTKQEAPQS